jgi:hypothetical protein
MVVVHARQRKAAAQAEAHAAALAEQRRSDLVARFGEAHAEVILAHKVWVGATVEMVRESLGEPAAIAERVLKTKVKQTFKYWPLDRRRFALKVLIENGVVVSWDGPMGAG